MKGLEVILAKGITFAEVIPAGYAVKVPYMDSIVCISLAVLPVVDTVVNGIKIVKGFISRKELYNDILSEGEKPTFEQKLHTRGLALEIAWDNYSYESALAVARVLFDNINDNMFIVIRDNSLSIYRHMKDKRIVRETNGSRSVIMK